MATYYESRKLTGLANGGQMGESSLMQGSGINEEIEALGRIINAEKMFKESKDQEDLANIVFKAISRSGMTGGVLVLQKDIIEEAIEKIEKMLGEKNPNVARTQDYKDAELYID